MASSARVSITLCLESTIEERGRPVCMFPHGPMVSGKTKSAEKYCVLCSSQSPPILFFPYLKRK